MKVLMDVQGSCHFDPARFLDFSKFENQAGDYLLLQGLPQWVLVEKYRGNKIVYLNFEEPNGLFSNNLSCHTFEKDLYKIFTICPYIAEWLNGKFNTERRELAFIPFNKDYIPNPTQKVFDVIYTGGIHANHVVDAIKHVLQFKHCVVSYNPAPYVTHIDPDYKTKLELISQSKITLVHNLLEPRPTHIKNALAIYPDALNCKAYSLVKNSVMLAPQLKTRGFEAAFCKSLILCLRDPWKLFEQYFEPDKEFLYYNNVKELPNLVSKIVNNYDQYKPIIENAYNRAINNYTTEHFFNKFLKDLV